MLQLLYHKHSPIVATVIYKSTFFKKKRLRLTSPKNVRRYYFYSGVTIMKLSKQKLFELLCIKNMFLNILQNIVI